MSQYKPALAHHRWKGKGSRWCYPSPQARQSLTTKKSSMKQGEEEKQSDFSLLLALKSPDGAWVKPAGGSRPVVRAWEMRLVGLSPSSTEQSRGETTAVLLLSIPVVFSCPPLDSAFSHCLTLLRLCFPVRKFPKGDFSFPLSCTAVHAHSVPFYGFSLASAPFGSCSVLLLLLCATASAHLDVLLCSLCHARVSRGFVWRGGLSLRAPVVERALQKGCTWTETGI